MLGRFCFSVGLWLCWKSVWWNRKLDPVGLGFVYILTVFLNLKLLQIPQSEKCWVQHFYLLGKFSSFLKNNSQQSQRKQQKRKHPKQRQAHESEAVQRQQKEGAADPEPDDHLTRLVGFKEDRKRRTWNTRTSAVGHGGMCHSPQQWRAQREATFQNPLQVSCWCAQVEPLY